MPSGHVDGRLQFRFYVGFWSCGRGDGHERGQSNAAISRASLGAVSSCHVCCHPAPAKELQNVDVDDIALRARSAFKARGLEAT